MTDVLKIMFVEQPSEHGGRLGRHIEHDPRSWDHPFGVGVAPLANVLHKRHGSPFDQGNVGSCTGNATAGVVNTEPVRAAHTHKHLLREQDALALYELATQLDEFPGTYPPDDTGSSGLSAAKAAQQKGYIKEYKHAFSIDEALAALQVGPVITGVSWYEGFDKPDADGMVEIAGQVRGGHEFEIIGYHPSESSSSAILQAVNSWGSSWGKHGHFFFTVDTWAQLLGLQGDATVLIA